jgi:peptidoglycan LD-endopeptidase CwlK
MGYKFSKNSKDKLYTCHEDLIKIMEKAISISHLDFGISEGARSVERQTQLFNEGLSKIDGVTKKSKHNHKPSLAVDIFYYNGKANYETAPMCYLGGLIMGVAKIMKEEGKINSDIRWGGNWNQNGVILDSTFIDMPHFEII